MPRHAESLPHDATPTDDELPYFYCLLEDDNLVTRVEVRTEQLLEPDVAKNEVDLTIEILTGVTRATMDNGDFG